MSGLNDGPMRDTFLDSLAIHRPFLLKSRSTRERAKRIHLFSKNLLNTYYTADSALGAEDTAVNSREKSLVLMELLTGWKQVKKQTNKNHTQKMPSGTWCWGERLS